MATRVGGPAARQGGPRFAQFKLVLLGASPWLDVLLELQAEPC